MLSFSDSLKFIKQSFWFLISNKDIPVLFAVLLFITISIITYSKKMLANNTLGSLIVITIITSAYFIISLLITFYEAIIISIAIKRLKGESATVLNGVRNVFQCMNSIFIWGIILSTIGLLDKCITFGNLYRFFYEITVEQTYGTKKKFSDFFSTSYRDSSDGALWPVTSRIFPSWMRPRWAITPTSWRFMTYLVLPFLVYEQKGLNIARQQSDDFFGFGWKKTFSAARIIGMIGFILILATWAMFGSGFFSDYDAVFITCLLILISSIVAVTFTAIEKSALFVNYVLQTKPNYYEQRLLNRAYSKMDTLF